MSPRRKAKLRLRIERKEKIPLENLTAQERRYILKIINTLELESAERVKELKL